MRQAFTIIILLLIAAPSIAGGPFMVDPKGTGVPLRWENDTLRYVVDPGPLNSNINNTKAVSWISELLAIWTNASMANKDGRAIKVTGLETEFAGYVSSDVTKENYLAVIGAHKGEAMIIFDEDGSIIDDQLGIGSNKYVVGFASPMAFSNNPYFVGGVMVMNGLFVDGESKKTSEIDVDEYKAAMLHEIGHLLNLDHTQANIEAVDRAYDGDFSVMDEIPTMYPVLYSSDQLSLQTDDIVSIATQYPSDDYLAYFCSFKGVLMSVDGAGFQGADVVARSLDVESEWSDIRTIVSGMNYPAGSDNGEYELGGLLPGRHYVVGYRGLDQLFTGGSSIAPFDPPRSGIIAGLIEDDVVACETPTAEGAVLSVAKVEVDPDLVDASQNAGNKTGGSTAPSGGCSLIQDVPSS